MLWIIAIKGSYYYKDYSLHLVWLSMWGYLNNGQWRPATNWCLFGTIACFMKTLERIWDSLQRGDELSWLNTKIRNTYICLSLCVSGRLSVCVSSCLSVCLAGCLSVWLAVCLFDCLPVCLAVCVSGYLSVCLAGWLSVCLTGCLSVWLSVCELHAHLCILIIVSKPDDLYKTRSRVPYYLDFTVASIYKILPLPTPDSSLSPTFSLNWGPQYRE